MKDLSRHLKEAIDLNTERMPLYGKLTDGVSVKYSKRLIFYERLALSGAWIFDRVGDRLQGKGVPYMKAEFVEMALTPKFSETYPAHIDYEKSLQQVDVRPFKKQIKEQTNKRDFNAVVHTCHHFLEGLNQQPHVYCMLRHLIESLGRIAFMIPVHQEKCASLNLKFPIRYSIFLLHTHRLMLNQAINFDEDIAQIQNKGIPFLYQDLPPIDIEAL